MRRTFTNTICAVITAATCMVPVWAEPMVATEAAQAIVEADRAGVLYLSGDALYFNGVVEGDIVDAAINKVFRTEDFSTITGKHTITSISQDMLEKLAYQDDYVLTWCADNVKNIVPDGYNEPAALRAVYDWISAIPYDTQAVENGDTSYLQSAYGALTGGTAVCASYSKLFRAMVECIPFSANGFVDWENGDIHKSVSVVSYHDGRTGHEWATIKTTILRPLWTEVMGNAQDLSKYCGEEYTLYFDITRGRDGFAEDETSMDAYIRSIYPESSMNNWKWQY